jgi:hypothetical protein
MLAAIKSAEGGRNGPADMDSIGPIDEASALDESAPIDVRRRSQFMADAKERKDEFTKEAPDWIKLSHTYKWPAFALSMRNYLKQVSQHYPLPTLAEVSKTRMMGLSNKDLCRFVVFQRRLIRKALALGRPMPARRLPRLQRHYQDLRSSVKLPKQVPL